MKTYKIVMLSGSSGSGKTTLAIKIGELENAKIIFISKIIIKEALRQGFKNFEAYFDKYGIKEGFKLVRKITLTEILKAHKSGNVIVEGMYDQKLFGLVVSNVGRENIVLINVTGNKNARIERISTRSNLSKKQAEKELRKRDRIKYAAGLHKIVQDSNITIRENTQKAAFEVYKKHRMQRKK
ncbi:MAG: AAA family ATPase [archaeon]|nr:AAA family ATPase [archaeon]